MVVSTTTISAGRVGCGLPIGLIRPRVPVTAHAEQSNLNPTARRSKMNSLAEPTSTLVPRYLDPLSILPPEPVTRKLLILGDSPIFTRAIQALLQNGSTACSSQIVTSAELGRRPGARQVDTVLLVPQDWQELAEWLARLRRRLAPCPWLLLADLRLVGMFL